MPQEVQPLLFSDLAVLLHQIEELQKAERQAFSDLDNRLRLYGFRLSFDEKKQQCIIIHE